MATGGKCGTVNGLRGGNFGPSPIAQLVPCTV